MIRRPFRQDGTSAATAFSGRQASGVGIFDFFRRRSGGLPELGRTYLGDTAPRVVTVWSSKGGVGKTTIAVNLAVYLRKAGRRVVVVDIDEFGAAGYMGARQEQHEARYGGEVPGPEWLWSSINDIYSFDTLKAFLIHNDETDVYVLSSPQESDPQKRLTAKSYDRITELLLRHFDIVIFDCGPAYQQDTIRFALLRCDCLVAPFTQNSAMLRNFAVMIREFSRPTSGVGIEKMLLVLNSYKPILGILTEAQARETFKDYCRGVAVLPEDAMTGMETVSTGDMLLLTTKSPELREGFRALAQAVLDVLYGKKAKQ